MAIAGDRICGLPILGDHMKGLEIVVPADPLTIGELPRRPSASLGPTIDV